MARRIISPDAPPLETVAWADHRKLPDVAASQNETWLMVSEPERVNSGVLLMAIAPDDAAENVQATRVVCELAADVADAPGSPVCILA